MRALKVFLFIAFLLTAVFGLIGLFSPATMAQLGMAPPDAFHTRIFSTGILGFAVAMWYAFRDPRKNAAIILAVITWFGLEALVLLISGFAGAAPWADALPGIIIDAVIAAGLAYFYPRGKKATSA